MTKPQHQGSLHDQLRELIQLAATDGLYDAADWIDRYLRLHTTDVEQIAAWFDAQAAKEQELLDGIARKFVELPNDPNNHRAPARDADGEPGNESE